MLTPILGYLQLIGVLEYSGSGVVRPDPGRFIEYCSLSLVRDGSNFVQGFAKLCHVCGGRYVHSGRFGFV